MKKVGLLVLLALVICAFTAIAAEEKVPSVTLPKTGEKPVITVQAEDIEYLYDQYEGPVGRLTFYTDYAGNLKDIWVVRLDRTAFRWSVSKEIELETGSKDDLEKLLDFFKIIRLPAIRTEFRGTEDTHVGSIVYNPPTTWLYVGSEGLNEPNIILKNGSGGFAIVKENDFLFPPPHEGMFRLGKKAGKIVVLVDQGGKWFVPATDYYGAPKVAEKK
jgi:hypothetical protein